MGGAVLKSYRNSVVLVLLPHVRQSFRTSWGLSPLAWQQLGFYFFLLPLNDSNEHNGRLARFFWSFKQIELKQFTAPPHAKRLFLLKCCQSKLSFARKVNFDETFACHFCFIRSYSSFSCDSFVFIFVVWKIEWQSESFFLRSILQFTLRCTKLCCLRIFSGTHAFRERIK